LIGSHISHYISNSAEYDYGLKNLETPVFIQKNENVSPMLDEDAQIMLAQVKEDISKITSKLKGVKGNKKKIKLLHKGKKKFRKRSISNIQKYPKRSCSIA